MCDVMGDIRLIRHFILHNKGVADNRIQRLKLLTWMVKGPIVFSGNDMEKIQKAINDMSIYLQDT